MTDFFTWDSEDGLPGVIVLTPITGTQWKRNDDQIDYYEEVNKGFVSPEAHVEILDIPLHPYNNYIDNETGKLANNTIREWIYQFRNANLELSSNKSLDAKKHHMYHIMLQTSLKKLGCKLHWTEKWNVAIPTQIQDYCQYVEMFKDNTSIWKLKPMIYTYWT